jgi:hypothetical protein
VAVASGVSVGAAVWQGCEGMMWRGKSGLAGVEDESAEVKTLFLIIVSVI